MRSEQLEALVIISRCQSLSVASEQLHITVQALSTSIKSLEKELGMTLIERNYKGVKMTKDGLAVVAVASEFFSKMYKLQFKNVDPRIIAFEQPINIYVQDVLYELIMPRMICTLKN